MAQQTTQSVHSNKIPHCVAATLLLLALLPTTNALAQSQPDATASKSESTSPKVGARKKGPHRPKLVVMLAVDQMRADYVDKFQFQWTGGLKRLVDEGAWFRDAAYPYAATETCVGQDRKSTRLNSVT